MIRAAIRSLFGIVPTLDLHGLGVKQALAESERFLAEMSARGERRVRIVFGKGRGSPGGIGVLRQVIPSWLEGSGRRWVERFERQLEASGADGGLVAWLRRSEIDTEPGDSRQDSSG